MKLRWPISPCDESLVSSLSSVLVPPLRPATHSSFSFSRLSSNSLAMLTCGMGRPVSYQLVQLGGAGRGKQLVPENPVAEHLRELGQDLQVGVGRAVGHQQHEDQVDRLGVRSVEGNRLAGAHQCPDRLLQTLDAAVRNRDAATEAGRAELLTGEQAVEYLAARDLLVVLEHEAGLLEDTFLAARVEIDGNVASWKQFRDQAHVVVLYFIPLRGNPAPPAGAIRWRGASTRRRHGGAPGPFPCA